MKNFLIGLLDWVYKKKCYFCGKSAESTKMCINCFEDMEFLPVEVNRKIGKVDVYCCGVYEKNLQKLIRGLKYHNQRELAYYQAKFMHDYWQNVLNKKEFYHVIPVPIYKTREKSRKYNHMKLVGEEFCKLCGYNLNEEIIIRVKDTKPQYRLTRPQRMENLANAFKINKDKLPKEPIMILDDICTTGSTFENIIFELKTVGAEEVVALATTTPFERGVCV